MNVNMRNVLFLLIFYYIALCQLSEPNEVLICNCYVDLTRAALIDGGQYFVSLFEISRGINP